MRNCISSRYPGEVKLLTRLLSRFERPGASASVIGLALLLASPALLSPLFADDLLYEIRTNPDRSFRGVESADKGYFVFASGDPEARVGMMEEGVFSWWTAEGFKLAFWRPLATWTHVLDTALWPGDSVMIHAHSLLWFLALLVAVSRL
ncbi:MAG: hypothetical protein QF464_20965, partial [Myxococcota bacterium]|nr:hypothetical protein [Myxococcota bacterium]